MIELRSDTFTLPTDAMRRAMVTAPLGNDSYDEDPTAQRLEELAAARLGKQAACLMPTGTMANLAAILAHAPRGTKIIVGSESDIYLYEAAGAAVCGGVGYEPVANQHDGTLDLRDVAAAFPEDPDDPQFALVSLICLENTQNRCGGAVLSLDYQRRVAEFARDRGVPVHLDGARVFNAATALGVSAAEVAADADSVQFCLSKGLCAPVGSMVAGSAAYIRRVRRIRKMLGGGMHQAGVVAAAGIVALTEQTERLGDDHALARRLGDGLRALGVVVEPVHTNIVLFRPPRSRWTPADFVAAAATAGLRLLTFGHGRVRAVTHAGVTPADIDNALSIVERLVARELVP